MCLPQLRRVALARAAATTLAGLVIAVPATAAASPGNPPEGLVSPRYQAKSCDTAALAASAANSARAGEASGRESVAIAGIAATAVVEPGARELQYQLRNSISHHASRDSLAFRRLDERHSRGSCAQIASSTASTTFETSLQQDGRRLLQIAVAFAIAYVLFLTVWFWGTRERRTRVGRAARS